MSVFKCSSSCLPFPQLLFPAFSSKMPSKVVGKGKIGFNSFDSWMVMFLTTNHSKKMGGKGI